MSGLAENRRSGEVGLLLEPKSHDMMEGLFWRVDGRNWLRGVYQMVGLDARWRQIVDESIWNWKMMLINAMMRCANGGTGCRGCLGRRSQVLLWIRLGLAWDFGFFIAGAYHPAWPIEVFILLSFALSLLFHTLYIFHWGFTSYSRLRQYTDHRFRAVFSDCLILIPIPPLKLPRHGPS